jgi:hypothetical protein
MSAPQSVLDLIEHFEREIEAFKSGKYNEAQLRLQFLDPLFKALGWDLYNENKYAEAYKDVIHEDSLRIGTGVKARSLARTFTSRMNCRCSPTKSATAFS